MSYWAATVISSVVQSIPLIGEDVYYYVVGGLGVSDVTLNRAFAAHILLGTLILVLSVVHVHTLHKCGSNNPLGIDRCYGDTVSFHSTFTFKDIFAGLCVMMVVGLTALTHPYLTLDTARFEPANPLVTPTTIKPEWYFLPVYAMLRSIESKLGGLALVLLFLFVL